MDSISVLLRLVDEGSWLIEQETGAAARFHADDSSYVRDPRFSSIRAGTWGANEVPLLKSRQHLRKEEATKIWTQLKEQGGNLVNRFGRPMLTSDCWLFPC